MEVYIVACLHQKLVYCYTVNTSFKKHTLPLKLEIVF